MDSEKSIPENSEKKIDTSFLELENVLKMSWEAQQALLSRVINYQLQSEVSLKYEEGPESLARPSIFIKALGDALDFVNRAKIGTDFFNSKYARQCKDALRLLKYEIENIGKDTIGRGVGFSAYRRGMTKGFIGRVGYMLKQLRDKGLIQFVKELRKEMAIFPVYRQGIQKRRELYEGK